MEKSVLERIPVPQVENQYNMTSTSQQYPAPQHGGRVPNINDPTTFHFAARPYKMYSDTRPIYEDDARQDLIGHIHKETPLNAVFFSKDNMDRLQKDIRTQVLAMSGGKYSFSPRRAGGIPTSSSWTWPVGASGN